MFSSSRTAPQTAPVTTHTLERASNVLTRASPHQLWAVGNFKPARLALDRTGGRQTMAEIFFSAPYYMLLEMDFLRLAAQHCEIYIDLVGTRRCASFSADDDRRSKKQHFKKQCKKYQACIR